MGVANRMIRLLCFLTGGHKWIALVGDWDVCFKCRHERNAPEAKP